MKLFFVIVDLNNSFWMSKFDLWNATYNQASEYYIRVSFVVSVRTKSDIIWRCKPLAIIDELNKIQITYKEDHRPLNENYNKKFVLN